MERERERETETERERDRDTIYVYVLLGPDIKTMRQPQLCSATWRLLPRAHSWHGQQGVVPKSRAPSILLMIIIMHELTHTITAWEFYYRYLFGHAGVFCHQQ